MLVTGYPLLAAAHLTNWLGAFVELFFFMSFSAMVAVELFEPIAD